MTEPPKVWVYVRDLDAGRRAAVQEAVKKALEGRPGAPGETFAVQYGWLKEKA